MAFQKSPEKIASYRTSRAEKKEGVSGASPLHFTLDGCNQDSGCGIFYHANCPVKSGISYGASYPAAALNTILSCSAGEG